ncbi:protocatechuate 3,4-dioxygenase [Roseibium sp. SCP14]|uniref:protocatechuate 3,4-dioxygenase n=1 Tax=Roseibium sp. SCP14 TaxID=3141375 RepID=UPI003336C98F
MTQSGNRRWALGTLAASTTTLALAALTRPVAALTPAQTEGPYYPSPRMRFSDTDNDLVRIDGKVREAGGEIIILKGRVLDGTGSPVAGARVEIWQCDANGRYLHSRESGPAERDAAFQGFGHAVTQKDGTYAFRTIKPVAYPGRTPHIHVKVFSGNTELTTQFYIAGHPQNNRDSLYRRLSPEQRKLVEMQFKSGADWPETSVDLIVS